MSCLLDHLPVPNFWGWSQNSCKANGRWRSTLRRLASWSMAQNDMQNPAVPITQWTIQLAILMAWCAKKMAQWRSTGFGLRFLITNGFLGRRVSCERRSNGWRMLSRFGVLGIPVSLVETACGKGKDPNAHVSSQILSPFNLYCACFDPPVISEMPKALVQSGKVLVVTCCNYTWKWCTLKTFKN